MGQKIDNDTKIYSIHIVQQVSYGMTPELCEKVLNSWDAVKLFAYITHDQDISDTGDPVEPHMHLILKFVEGKEPNAGAIINRFNLYAGFDVLSFNRLEHIGKHARVPQNLKWASGCAYLSHELPSCKDKHQYDRAKIVCNFNINIDIEAVLCYLDDRERSDYIISGIGDGTITRYNYTQYISINEAIRYRVKIEAAFKYREDMLSADIDRNMRCMYLYGAESGVGKTDFAKRYCKKLGLSVSVSSSQNDPWQDYTGTDAFVLDDWRPAGWSVADMLKMCDPYTCTSVKSRYRNKDTHNLKLLIFTSTLPFDDIWSFMDDATKGPKAQLSRRISLRATITKERIAITDYETGDTLTFENPAQQYEKQEKAPSRLFEMQAVFGGSISPAAEIGAAPSVTPHAPEEEPGPWDDYIPHETSCDTSKGDDVYD